MIGDVISVKPHHLPPARKIFELTQAAIAGREKVYTFSVGGESGSGKSTLSLAIKKVLEDHGYSCFVFHIDDYFKLPPEDNHQKRLENISRVGPDEVNLALLQEHIDAVRHGARSIKKPLVHYRENQIRQVVVELEKVDVIIAEGTYTTMLDNIDCKIFMLRNYLDTYDDRMERARDQMIPFVEKVLEIEHQVLQKHVEMADIIVDKDYNVSLKRPKNHPNK